MLETEVEELRDDFWAARVSDDEHPWLEIAFTYLHTDQGGLMLGGVSVAWGNDAPRAEEITVYDLRRDFPLSAWERAARLAVVSEIREAGLVAEDRPELSPVPRLLGIAMEYRANIAAGVADPVAALAREHRVRPETARAWVHRARKKGWLGPARPGAAGELPPRLHLGPSSPSPAEER